MNEICPICEQPAEVYEEGRRGASCNVCKIYWCPNCQRWHPWELGCAHEDGRDHLCDNCWCDEERYRYVPVDEMYDRYRAIKSAWEAYWWRRRGNGYLSSEDEMRELRVRDREAGINKKLGIPEIYVLSNVGTVA